ncbi:MAG TPA: hypothetical protein DEQ61_01160 [Streptomyces sp.]|nr:hypothetical protein [Streptomyces sp.]
MSAPGLRSVHAFRAVSTRRRAARGSEPAGGFAALDADYRRSREHNRLVIDGVVAPAELAALADADRRCGPRAPDEPSHSRSDEPEPLDLKFA